MGATTSIQWCHHTFNPWRGCTKIAPGCENCYAAREAKRFPKLRGVWGNNGKRVRAADWSEPHRWNAAAAKAGERRRVFCASLADIFEDWRGVIHDHQGRILYRCSYCGAQWASRSRKPAHRCQHAEPIIEPLTMARMRIELFDMIDMTPWLDWLILTKRPENVGKMWPAPTIQRCRDNVWLLTSVSDQATAELMIPRLLESYELVALLGVSAEPLLAPIDFSPWLEWCADQPLRWVIFGGESGGTSARPCNLEWIRSGVEQLRSARVPAFVKQAGSFPLVPSFSTMASWALRREHLVHRPPHRMPGAGELIEVHLKHPKGGDLAELPEELQVREYPTRVLEGALA